MMEPLEPNETGPESARSTMQGGTASTPAGSTSRLRSALWIAGGIALAFLIGFGWQFVRAQRLSSELDAARYELTLRDLEATLAAATLEAHSGDYESARRLASQFFTGLQAAVVDAPPDAQPQLRDVLARRDTTITALSRSAATSTQLLEVQLERYRSAVHGQEEAPLVPDVPEPADTASGDTVPATEP